MKWLRYIGHYLQVRRKYVGNNVDMWEMAKIYGKWLKYLKNGLINWGTTQRFGKWLKHLGSGLDIWGRA